MQTQSPLHARRLLELPPIYARPIPNDVQLPAVLHEARALALRIEDNDPDDAQRSHRRALVDELERGADLLEQTDEALARAIVTLEKERIRIAPAERERAARHALVLVAATHGRGAPDERALFEATAWLGGLDAATSARVIVVMRREKEVQDADELRRRAYHALRVTMSRATGARPPPVC